MSGIVFEQLSGKTHVARGAVNLGAVELGSDAVALIDSGSDEETGRKVLRFWEARGRSIAVIANTHSNADHCGGNAFIQSRSSCRVAATRKEAAVIEWPELEPAYLWGGYPLPALRNKFLMAKASSVTDILDPPCEISDTGLRTHALPGHFFDMVGYMTPDLVFFAADTVASPAILDKYHVFFLYDVAAQLRTLDELAKVEAEWFVPSHAEPVRDIRPLIEVNRGKINEIAESIVEICVEPRTPDELIARVASRFGLDLNHQQYVLIGATIRSYLSWLTDLGTLRSRFENGVLMFYTYS